MSNRSLNNSRRDVVKRGKDAEGYWWELSCGHILRQKYYTKKKQFFLTERNCKECYDTEQSKSKPLR